MLTPDLLDDQLVYYQSRASTLIGSPILYHTANQHYSNCGAALFGGSPMASHPASTTSQCVGAGDPMTKLVEGPHESCLMLRQESFMQKALTPGTSPPTRYIHGQAQGKAASQIESDGQHLTQITASRGNHVEQAPESVPVKQESLRYAYLEDGEYYC